MTNAWTLSPSPPLDALSSESSSSSSSSSAFLVGWHVTSTLSHHLWDAYVTYLWYYQPNSWVGRLASTFRILAVILILPVILLTLLDVTSYVIARTLGVVDDVKASTSDARSKMGVAVPVAARVPTTACTCPCPSSSPTSTSISTSTSTTSSSLLHGVGVGGTIRVSEGLAPEDDLVERRTGRDGDGDGPGDGDRHNCVSETAMDTSTATHTHAHAHAHAHAQTTIQSQIRSQARMRLAGQDADASDASPQAYYFAGEEDLRLAGEGVFSPAVSMPPSPLTPRMPLHTFAESDGREVGQVADEGIVLRRRAKSVQENELGHA